MHHTRLTTVAEAAAHQAEQRPDSLAFVCEGRETSFRQLHEASNRIARAIQAGGLRPGARVGWLGKESEHYFAVFFACAKSGTVLVPINWRLRAPEVKYIVTDSETELLFFEEDFAELAGGAARVVVQVDSADGRGAALAAWCADQPADDLAPITGPDDAVAQLYTSGTTGVPKGVVLAQRSFFAIRDGLAAADCDWIDWQDDDVSLVGIPGFHVAGIWWAMQAFAAGVPSVSMRSFSAADAVALIREAGWTTSLVVPAMLQAMLTEPGVGPDDFKGLRKVAYGGSPISESLLQESLDVLGCELIQLYGLTESGNAAICLPAGDHLPGSPLLRAAGKPLPGVTVRVLDPQGIEVPTGESGEICLDTPAAMVGYWQLPDATATTLVDGWLHTGDAGYVDADGYVFIRDRLKDTIIVSGENVYPAEVENALCLHPAVLEAAVIGIPHERRGEAVCAYVVLRAGFEVKPRELMSATRAHIADFKVPSRYEFIDKLPRAPTGKILRRDLRDQYWAHLDRHV